MKSLFSNKYLLLVSRLILGTTFIVASIDKITAPETFAISIAAYKLVPFELVNILALIVPWLELICGILILIGEKLKGSSMIVCSLLFVFILALISTLIRGLEIDCGCFGMLSSSTVSWWRVIEDLVLFMLGLQIFFYSGITAADKSLSLQPVDE